MIDNGSYLRSLEDVFLHSIMSCVDSLEQTSQVKMAKSFTCHCIYKEISELTIIELVAAIDPVIVNEASLVLALDLKSKVDAATATIEKVLVFHMDLCSYNNFCILYFIF